MQVIRIWLDEGRQFVAAHPKSVLLTLALLAAYKGNVIQRLWRQIFVFFEVRLSRRLNSKLRGKKAALFAPLFRPDAAAGEGQPLRIVEIGLGGGSNLDFYPENAEIIGVDPNPDYLKYLEAEMKTASGRRLKMTRVICAGAEEMDQYLAPDSADAVVATLVLCSVRDVEAVVANCWRVLRPGGGFYFLHHNRGDPVREPWKVWCQDWVTPLTFRLGDGCHFNRDPIGVIQTAGFSSVNFEKYAPSTGSRLAAFSLVHPFLIGRAVK